MDIRFRRLRDEEFETAYAIVCERTEWLLSKGVRQWERPLPEAIYYREFRDRQIYTLAVADRLAVVLSLMWNPTARWRRTLGRDPHWWLCTLVSSLGFRGRGLGGRAVQEAAAYLAGLGAGELYLDCISHSGDFLPRYYAALGFQELARRTVPRRTGHDVEMALMRLTLSR